MAVMRQEEIKFAGIDNSTDRQVITMYTELEVESRLVTCFLGVHIVDI